MDWTALVLTLGRAVGMLDGSGCVLALPALDTVRAQAFATGDPALLDDVYVPGSAALDADARTIAAYASRGARVDGARLEILSCRAVSVSSGVRSLDVVDRLGPARAVWPDGSRRSLPHDEPTRHTITLVRAGSGWRIAG